MENSEKKKYFTTKRIIILLLSLAVFFGIASVIIHFATRVTNESYEQCVLGDINGDGLINSADSLEIIKQITGNTELFESQIKNGDANADGNLDSADALILLRYCIGDVKSLPYTEDDSQNTAGDDNKTATYEKDNLFATVKILNQWKNSDDTTSYQISVIIKNSSAESIDDWTAKIKFNSNVDIIKKWDCSTSDSKNIVSVSGDEIQTSSAVTCGFIVKCENELSINTLEME